MAKLGISFKNDKYRGVGVNEISMPELRARLAINLVERWGGVAGKLDGEDSRGRARIGLQTPEELVERAVTCAELLVAAINAKGWLHDVPAEIEKAEDG